MSDSTCTPDEALTAFRHGLPEVRGALRAERLQVGFGHENWTIDSGAIDRWLGLGG